MAVLAILRRDLTRYRRNPGRTAFLFALPLVLAGIFALVFGGGGVGEDITIRVLLWDEDQSLLSLLARGASGADPEAGRLEVVEVGPEGLEMMERGEASALVRIPEGFTDDYLAGVPVRIELVKNPSERFLPQVVEEGLGVGRAVLTVASRVLGPELEQVRAFTMSESFPPDLAVGDLSARVNSRLRGLERYLFPPAIELETVTVDPAGESEGAAEIGILAFFLPGLAVMGVLFLAQSATRDILRDREAGLVRHLLTAPVSPAQYLVGKCLSVLLVTGIGFAALIAVGWAAGVAWGPPAAVAALIAATAIAASGTLLLIMSLVATERQGDALTTIVIIAWSMLGGAFVPLPSLPDFVRPLSATTLVYWAVDGFNELVLRGGGLVDVLPNLAVLLGVGAAFLAAGALLLGRKIRRGVL